MINRSAIILDRRDQVTPIVSRRVVIGGLAGLALEGALSGCSQRLATFRYRLTVEAETPAGRKIGSSVVEVATVDQGKGFPGPEAGGIRRDARGQAVVIELAPQRYIFALLGKRSWYDYAAALPIGVLQPLIGSGRHPIGVNTDRRQDWLSYDAFQARMVTDRNVWPVPRTVPANAGDKQQDFWPDFVQFENVENPMSVKSVSPDAAGIRRVMLQIVDEPITTGIRAILPWLNDPTFGTKPTIINDDALLSIMTSGNLVRGDR